MYEELIGELYIVASGVQSKRRRELLEKAADAIEDLQQTIEQMKAIVIVEAQHTEMFDERDKKTLMEMVKSLPLQIIPGKDEKPRWIPVTEQVPKDFQKVLVFWISESEPMIDTAFWLEAEHQFDCEHWISSFGKITHWIPLPEPPKEG